MAEVEFHLEPNSIINDKYRIIKEIGRGSFGVVWQAVSQRTLEPVALKHSLNSIWVTRECVILSRVGHLPVCPRYFSMETCGTRTFVAMSLEGKDMDRVTKESPGDKLSRHNVQVYMTQGLNALKQFHYMDFVHRDIKLDNFALGMSPEKAQLVLIDLVFAEQFDRENNTFNIPHESFKSVHQAPPLILRGGEWTDGCDIFLFALTVLRTAGYPYQYLNGNATETQRAIAHEYRFANLKNELATEDHYLIPFLEATFEAAQKPNGFVDYEKIYEILAAQDGFNPHAIFDIDHRR